MKTEMKKVNAEDRPIDDRSTGTVKLHRVFGAKPDKVFRAFTTDDAVARWLPPDGFTCSVDRFDAKVGGTYRMSFTNFTTQKSHAFGGKFLEIEPNELIRYTDIFEDPNFPGEIITTVKLREVSVGTEVSITQKGISIAIPEAACYIGWQQSLNYLAKLVEPDIKEDI